MASSCAAGKYSAVNTTIFGPLLFLLQTIKSSQAGCAFLDSGDLSWRVWIVGRARSNAIMDPIKPPLLDKHAVAARLHVHEQTVLEWAREGSIECLRLGFRTIRFTEEHVSRFLARAAQRQLPRRKRINGARKHQT